MPRQPSDLEQKALVALDTILEQTHPEKERGAYQDIYDFLTAPREHLLAKKSIAKTIRHAFPQAKEFFSYNSFGEGLGVTEYIQHTLDQLKPKTSKDAVLFRLLWPLENIALEVDSGTPTTQQDPPTLVVRTHVGTHRQLSLDNTIFDLYHTARTQDKSATKEILETILNSTLYALSNLPSPLEITDEEILPIVWYDVTEKAIETVQPRHVVSDEDEHLYAETYDYYADEDDE